MNRKTYIKKLIKFLKFFGVHHLYSIYLVTKRIITELYLFILKFGIKKGLFLYKIIRKEQNNKIISIKLDNIKYSFFMRKGTSDPEVFKQIFLQEDYNYKININPKLIIDCGANNGYSAIYFANKFPKSIIYAIEPENSNFELLEKNTSKYKNIICLKKGIWDKNTNLKLSNPQKGHPKLHWSFQVQETNDNNNKGLEAITLNKLLEISGFKNIDILKIDIEGAEKKVFESSDDGWLDKTNYIFIESHENFLPGCDKAIFTKAKKFNFKIHQKGENYILQK